jgi:ribosomal-protein-alanine acetyltransferase/tRNA threonylcarbamoyl adenosine modification protein YeaZ
LNESGHTLSGTVLVCEGSLFPPGAALLREGELLGVAEQEGTRASRGGLFSLASSLMSDAGVGPHDLSALVVGTGPGSFTGVRVALGLARGLVLARPALPVIGVDAPRVLAHAAGAALPARVAIPWGRLRVLLARARGEGPLPEEAALVTREELAQRSELEGESVVCPETLLDANWPTGTTLVPVTPGGARPLADLVAAGKLPTSSAPGAFPEPVYLVAPDAVLPVREGRTPDGYALVELGLDALDDVVALERSAFSSPWSESMLMEELRGGQERVAIGARDSQGKVAAYAIARHAPDALWILNVATDPAKRRLGLARALVRALIGLARDAAHPRIDLEVRVDNDAAIALYASEGFVPVGRRPRYYRDGSDAILMSSVLSR